MFDGKVQEGCTTKGSTSNTPWCETVGACTLKDKWNEIYWKTCEANDLNFDQVDLNCYSDKGQDTDTSLRSGSDFGIVSFIPFFGTQEQYHSCVNHSSMNWVEHGGTDSAGARIEIGKRACYDICFNDPNCKSMRIKNEKTDSGTGVGNDYSAGVVGECETSSVMCSDDGNTWKPDGHKYNYYATSILKCQTLTPAIPVTCMAGQQLNVNGDACESCPSGTFGTDGLACTAKTACAAQQTLVHDNTTDDICYDEPVCKSGYTLIANICSKL